MADSGTNVVRRLGFALLLLGPVVIVFAELSLPIAVLLLIVRVVVTRRALRRQRALYSSPEQSDGWTLPTALVVLGAATVVTAFVTETLVGTLRSFADRAHLSSSSSRS